MRFVVYSRLFRLIPVFVLMLLEGDLTMKAFADGTDWTLPEIALHDIQKHPVIACTRAELELLRAAYRGTGPEYDVIAARIESASNFLDEPIVYPPRGGQHNQWYQCDQCQMGLVTVDDAHHRCPKCETIYTGEPYDDVIFSRQHGRNFSRAATSAWAYAITGDDRYAQYTAGVLLGYSERYLTYPYHNAGRTSEGHSGGRIWEQTLTEASHFAANIAPAYDLIYDSGVLSATRHAKIQEGLILPMLQSIDSYKAGQGNWQTWHNAAMIAGGAVIGDVSWIKKAIADPENGFAYQLSASVSDEGMWYENSWGYHFYALMAMTRIAESARRLGLDLWSHPKLKAMVTLPVQYTMADGSLPRFGDSLNTRMNNNSPIFEAAYAVNKDPALRAFLSRKPTWESILHGRKTGHESLPQKEHGGKIVHNSQLFKSAGHAILRTRGKAGLTAALSFSPFGGFHAHFDKLGFVLFGYERELGVDPGRALSQAYRLPIHGKWYRATLSHNTVLVDGNSQEEAGGRLECFVANEEYAGVIASTTESYPGIRHLRLLLLTPEYALVFDDLDGGETSHRYDWLYHNRGTEVKTGLDTKSVELTNEPAGMEYIQDAKQGRDSRVLYFQVADAWKIKDVTPLVDEGGVTTHLWVAGQADTEFLTGTGPGGTVLDRVPMVRVTRHGKRITFAAVIEPVPTGDKPSIEAIDVTPNPGAYVVEMRRGSTMWSAMDTVIIMDDNTFSVQTRGGEVLRGIPDQQ